MDNRGKITVFLCMMTGIMLFLGLNVLKVIDLRVAKAKVAICCNTSMSSVKALYNNYIFDKYHILLFDKNCSGRGEGFLENQIKELLAENLGSDFKVDDVRGANYELVVEEGYAGLKKQIEDYMIYAGIEYGYDKIKEATGGKDGTISDEVLEDMDKAETSQSEKDSDKNKKDNNENDSDKNNKDNNVSSINEQVVENESDSDSAELTMQDSDKDADIDIDADINDPRKFVRDFLNDAYFYIVLPEGMKPSKEVVDIYETPSFSCGKGGNLVLFDDTFDRKFDDIKVFKSDITYHDSWMDKLADKGAVSFYARKVFNSATNTEKNDTTAFKYELEYLVAGRNSDSKNIRKTIDEIIAIRMPVNFLFLLKDVYRISQVKKISWSLSIVTHIPEKIIRYLIAGCWSYIESIAEVRHLLKGDRMPFLKNSSNWITDLKDIGGSLTGGEADNENGLCYEDYLMILLSLDTDKTCMRMLDLMEINAQLEDEKFQMESAAMGCSMDFIVKYGKYDCSLGLKTEY